MNIMSASKSQEKRIARLATELGEDTLVATRLDASEGMSRLFEYRLEAVSADPDVDLDALIGRNMTMSLETPDGSLRHFDGIAVEAEWAGQRIDDFVYRFVLRPWFFLLSRRTDCKIFHEKTAPEIVSEVMQAHPFAHFESRLTKTYTQLEYTVQYRESDLAFCTRLMEKHGIGYYFRHEPGRHVLVLSDSLSSYDPIPGGQAHADSSRSPASRSAEESQRQDRGRVAYKTGTGGGGIRPFFPKGARQHVDGEHVHTMLPQRRFTSGRVMLNAYDFKRPYADLKTEAQEPGAYEHASLELYDYPGEYVENGAGSEYSSARMSAEASRDKRRMVGGEMPSAYPGGLVTIINHPRDAENGEYLILQATHSFASQSYRSGSKDSDAYEGTYELLPSDQPYAPPAVTPKARVHGPQTAVVVGSGEIDVDEYGRVLVHFHWDRYGDKSKRVRVAQSWASQRWGGMVIPRVGMEVVVEYLEGDPDEPMIVGCVYNGNNMPPDSLPQFKTRSTFMTDTHKGGGFNGIRFEDENGAQEILIHAERYLNGIVGTDETWSIGGNAHRAVGISQSETVAQNRDVSIGAEHREAIGGSQHTTVGAAQVTSVGGAVSRTVGSSETSQVGADWTVSVGKSINLKASQSITLSVGGNFVKIDPTGIQIEGTMVRINCGGIPGLMPSEPAKPAKYSGPHAKRYDRSFKS